MYKNIKWVFSWFSLLLDTYEWVEPERVRDDWNAHAQQFFCETSLPFCFVLPGSKFFPGLYNYRYPRNPCGHFCSWHATLAIHAAFSLVFCLLLDTGVHPVRPPRNLLGLSKTSSCLSNSGSTKVLLNRASFQQQNKIFFTSWTNIFLHITHKLQITQ